MFPTDNRHVRKSADIKSERCRPEKKKRAVPFTPAEENIIVQYCEKKKSILFSKGGTGHDSKQKEMVWQEIADKINS